MEPSVEELERWAAPHWRTAQTLFNAEDPWAAVPAFYSCYQLLRAALINDPIFDDSNLLQQAHHSIAPGDRFESKHSFGGLSRPQLGLNELCIVLYPHVAKFYTLAHQASVGIRYEGGLPRHISLQAAMNYCETFRSEYLASHLTHTKSKALKAANG